MNELMKEAELLFFRGEIEEGTSKVAELVHKLDFDDDDDTEMLLRILDFAVFKNGASAVIGHAVDAGFDFSADFPGKGAIIPLCVQMGCFKAEVIELLANSGADPYACDWRGRTFLHNLLAREKPMWGDGPEVLLAELSGDFDFTRLCGTDKFGGTPLLYAVLYGHSDCVPMLCERGADPNSPGTTADGKFSFAMPLDGITPMHVAALMGRAKAAEHLSAHGARSDISDSSGRLPAHFLAQKPPQVFCPAFYGSFPAKQSVIDGRVKVLGVLDVFDKSDDRGNTPLLALFESGEWDYNGLILGMLAKGADAAAVNLRGFGALMFAAGSGNQDLVKELIDRCPIHLRNSDGNTALHLALDGRHSKTARYLIKKGAGTSLANNKGQTPAEIAAEAGLTEVLELLF